MWGGEGRLDEAQAGLKIARRNINNYRYADDTTLMAESEEELKSLLRKVKEEKERFRRLFFLKMHLSFFSLTFVRIDFEVHILAEISKIKISEDVFFFSLPS